MKIYLTSGFTEFPIQQDCYIQLSANELAELKFLECQYRSTII